jgi:transcriptional regulator with XRE-family HTH domain
MYYYKCSEKNFKTFFHERRTKTIMSQEDNTNQGTPPTNIWTLADLRNSHGLSMAKLAQLIDVTPATIWQWEQKSPSELRPKAIKALKTVFSETEVDSILHPEKYFDANGNPIKPINPPPEHVKDEGLPPQQPEQKEPEGLTG